jgi:predicted MFS family arabinose efflux permease
MNPPRRRTPAVVACCAGGFGMGINFTNLGAIAGRTGRVYGVSLTTVGLMTTALVASHAAMQIPGGRVTDRIGSRRVGTAALLFVTACNIGLLVAPEPALALSLRALMGVGTGFGFVALTDLIRSSDGSALSQGMFGGIGYGATALALAIVPQLEGMVAWRAPYVLSIATGTLSALLLLTTPGPAQREHHAARKVIALKSIVTDRGIYRLGAMHGIGLLSLAAGNWISILFVRGYGLSVGVAGLLGAVAIGGGLVSRPLAGLLLKRRPDLVRLMLGLSLMAGGGGVLVLALASSVPLGFAGAVLFGIAAGAFFGPAMFAAGRVRHDAPATAVAFVNTLGNTAVIIATPLLGLGFARAGDGRIGFVVLAAVWILGLTLIPRQHQLGLAPTTA